MNGGEQAMKIYEKPVVELVSFQAEEIMASQPDNFALYGHLGFSDVNTAAIADA